MTPYSEADLRLGFTVRAGLFGAAFAKLLWPRGQSLGLEDKHEAKVIRQRLHRMTHGVAHTARAAELLRDRQTDRHREHTDCISCIRCSLKKVLVSVLVLEQSLKTLKTFAPIITGPSI